LLITLAQAYAGSRRWDACETLVNEIAGPHKDSPTARAVRGLIALQQRDIPSGLALLHRAAADHDQILWPWLRVALANAFIRHRDLATATTMIDAVLRDTPDLAAAHDAAARLANTRHDLPSAIATAQRAVALAPTDSSFRFHLSILLERSGNADAALAQARIAHQYDAAHLPTLRLLAQLHDARGEADLSRHFKAAAHAAHQRDLMPEALALPSAGPTRRARAR
jgi:Flp pilus assembly protein TadD